MDDFLMEIFTDGGCRGNPGTGGWAYIINLDGAEYTKYGFEEQTTNNRMELTAVIRALEAAAGLRGGSQNSAGRGSARGPCAENTVLYTDSQYVQKGISEWILRWEKNGWKTAAKKPVKNKDLWIRLQELSRKINPEWRWIKGHAGNHFNEACDSLVQKAIKQAEKK
jgi:ribonuclease HI